MIKYVTPVVLGFMLVLSIVDEVRKGYEDYPTSALLIYGVLMVVSLVILGIIMASRPWHNPEMTKHSGFGYDYYNKDEQ